MLNMSCLGVALLVPVVLLVLLVGSAVVGCNFGVGRFEYAAG